MLVSRLGLLGVALATLGLSGCLAPQSQVDAMRVQNQSLSQQNRALAAQVENLQVHSRNTEDQLARAEENLALVDERLSLNQKQLTNYQREREQLPGHAGRLSNWRSRLTPEIAKKLADISRRYPSLQFDAKAGVAKMDTDILFDSGADGLKSGAEKVLAELAQLMKSPDGRDLRLMIVGHTDDQKIAGRPVREKNPSNFHLSTSRALAVADKLHKFGLPDERMGVAGFGPYQPVAPNLTAQDRQKNRRVEIFVMAPEVPVIGWTESTPGLY